jgi:hypothetical protein
MSPGVRATFATLLLSKVQRNAHSCGAATVHLRCQLCLHHWPGQPLEIAPAWRLVHSSLDTWPTETQGILLAKQVLVDLILTIAAGDPHLLVIRGIRNHVYEATEVIDTEPLIILGRELVRSPDEMDIEIGKSNMIWIFEPPVSDLLSELLQSEEPPVALDGGLQRPLVILTGHVYAMPGELDILFCEVKLTLDGFMEVVKESLLTSWRHGGMVQSLLGE